MSVQTEISRLESAKEAISTAIAGKGVTVPDGTMLDGMAALIESIEVAGGGGDSSGYQVASGSITFSTTNEQGASLSVNGFGFSPKAVLALTNNVYVNGSNITHVITARQFESDTSAKFGHASVSSSRLNIIDTTGACTLTLDADGFTITKSATQTFYYLSRGPWYYIAYG